MAETVLKVHFPRGALPVRGFRCAVCGHEELLAPDAKAAQDLARDLGLFGLVEKRVRKLQRHGNSITVSLDPVFLQKALGNATRGDDVEVGMEGQRIVIERAEKQKEA